MKPGPTELEIAWPWDTFVWDRDELVDVTSRGRANLQGQVSDGRWNIGYSFDRAIGLRHGETFWAIAYTNRAMKGALLKDGLVHRELNRSYYCAADYDYPVAIGVDGAGRAVVIHCPHDFDVLEIEDAESGENIYKAKSKHMEFHSRLVMSADGRFLLDAGWFWHPWNAACVFDLGQTLGPSSEETVAFNSGTQVDGAAFLGNTHLVVSSTEDAGKSKPEHLNPNQLGVWSLVDRRWESRVDLTSPTGTIMPWKDWIVSFYEYPKLIELSSGKVVHRWENIRSGRQVGPIDLGNPPPPLMALDPQRGRFAVADEKKVTVVTL